MAQHAFPIEIKASGLLVHALTFSADGEHVLSGGVNGVEVWRVKDGQRMATIEAKGVFCFAVSKNGRWIAAGSDQGEVFMLDAKTFDIQTVWNLKAHDRVEDSKKLKGDIQAVDFSPDSSRLVSGSFNAATIWDVESSEKVQILDHVRVVIAAKYSHDGDRIVTATWNGSVHVWDSNDGRSLFNIPVKVTPGYNHGLTWFKNHIFFVSHDKIERLDALTGSIVTQWPDIPNGLNEHSSIAIPKHGKFIAYSTGRAVTLWDAWTRLRLGVVEWPEEIRAITLSAGKNTLAVAHEDGKIIIASLSRGIHSLKVHFSHPTLQDVDIQINPTALEAWKCNRLDDAEAALTTAMSQHPNHHPLAARALIRARLGHSDAALFDAYRAIEIQPSIIAYIAKSLAHLGKGEKDKAYRACDIAFEHFHSTHVTLLLVLKAIIVFIAGEHLDAISRMDDLIATVPSNSLNMIQGGMHLLMGNMHVERGNYDDAIQSFERASAQVLHDYQPLPSVVPLMSGWTFDNLHITARLRLCEALLAAGRKEDAGESLVEMVNTCDDDIYLSQPITKWVSQFTEQCLSAPEAIHDPAGDRNASVSHATATLLLREWAKARLGHDSWQDALRTSANFVVPRFAVFRALCERLETGNRTMDAVECLRLMLDILAGQENLPNAEAKWVVEFKRRCCKKWENLGDVAMTNERHDDAISYYTRALSLLPPAPQGLLVKRSKVYLVQGLCAEASSDADKVIEMDPSSPWGYKWKHAALHETGDYQGAVRALEVMLSRISGSHDEEIRALRSNYVDPADTRAAIRRAVQDAIRDSPRVLISTISGRLCDKSDQAASIESFPVFNQLISSMTTRIDNNRIEQEVQEYYRYGMFSHKWEANEPLFGQVMRVVIHDLEESSTHNKLKMFCIIVQEAGLHWAWSDTCCINKSDNVVLQEALVSMFKWYQNSALTIVFLFDVLSPARRGDLTKSIWNTRAWTFQEYHASNVVRFYTKDWKLYLNLDIPNHKESLEIISEMEEATGVSARALTEIQPGLDGIREKLCLASTRKTTLVEDAAYSLLGIFSIPLPVVYGEGDQALGRLLAQLLMSSGDMGILSWTGNSGSFNSCLPTSIIAFKELLPLHIPSAIATTEMEKITTALRASSLSPTLVMQLYDQVQDLPMPFFVGQRLKLPCLIFKLGTLSTARNRVFRAQTDALGVVEIETNEDLSRFSPLYLVHPWIDYLLDRQSVGSGIETIHEESSDGQSNSLGEPSSFAGPSTMPAAPPRKRTIRFGSRFALPFGGLAARPNDAESLLPPSTVSQEDRRKRAFQTIARLKQPFGALLLAQNPGKIVAHKRVATETLITVKLQEVTPAVLNRLVSSVRVLDVL